MPHTSTKIYSENRNGVLYGVDPLADVSPVLGISSGDYGIVCASEAITPWSKIKPVRSSSKGVSGAANILALMKSANFGFGGSDMFANPAYKEVFEAAVAAGCSWPYLRPRGSEYNEPFRILDFDGYDHSASKPPITVGSAVSISDEGVRKCFLIFTVNTDASIQLKDFGWMNYYGPLTPNQNWKYAAMVRKLGDTGYPAMYYGIDVMTYDTDGITPVYNHRPYDGPHEVLGWEQPADGNTYVIVPCITRRYPGIAEGYGLQTIFLPSGKVFYDAGGSSLEPRFTDFEIISTTVTHTPTSQQILSTGGGYFDVSVKVRFTSWIRDTVEGYIPWKARVKLGGEYGALRQYNKGVYGDTYGKTVEQTLEFVSMYDYQLPAPVVPNFTGGPVFLDLYGDGVPLTNANYVITTLI